jgi:hypothetical protein
MILRAVTSITHRGVDYEKGDVFDALDEEATDLIRLGFAEEAPDVDEDGD